MQWLHWWHPPTETHQGVHGVVEPALGHAELQVHIEEVEVVDSLYRELFLYHQESKPRTKRKNAPTLHESSPHRRQQPPQTLQQISLPLLRIPLPTDHVPVAIRWFVCLMDQKIRPLQSDRNPQDPWFGDIRWWIASREPVRRCYVLVPVPGQGNGMDQCSLHRSLRLAYVDSAVGYRITKPIV